MSDRHQLRVFILGAGSSLYAGFPLGKRFWEFLLDHCEAPSSGSLERILAHLATLDPASQRDATKDFEGLLTKFESGEIPTWPRDGEVSKKNNDLALKRATESSMRHLRQNEPGFAFNNYWKAQHVRRQSAAMMWNRTGQLTAIRDIIGQIEIAFLMHHACIKFGRRHFWPGKLRLPTGAPMTFNRHCPCRQNMRIGKVQHIFDEIADKFHSGDTIVSFNYDVTIETSLWARRKWHFLDGYGVVPSFEESKLEELQKSAWLRSPSPVKVLKPHGSINWQQDTDKHLGLHHLDLLFDRPEFCTYEEELEDGVEMIFANGALIAPTYVKDYASSPILSVVWKQIEKALEAANEITVVGYSLPPGDKAARDRLGDALLKNRTSQFVSVISPEPPENWETFLSEANKQIKWAEDGFEHWITES